MKATDDILASGIYAITNTATGEQYVGSALVFVKRWADHIAALRAGKHGSLRMQRAWDRDGADAFDFTVLERVEGDKAKLLEREQAWIEQLMPLYNTRLRIWNPATPTPPTTQPKRELTQEEMIQILAAPVPGPVLDLSRFRFQPREQQEKFYRGLVEEVERREAQQRAEPDPLLRAALEGFLSTARPEIQRVHDLMQSA